MSKRPAIVPRAFWLAGLRWEVKDVPAAEHPEMGQTDPGTAVVTLRDDLLPQIRETTFLHELLHAMRFTRGVPLELHDEAEIDAEAALLHQFLLTRET